MEDKQDGRPLHGWRFVLASAGLFLVPVLLAIAGAACFAENRHGQFVGAVIGLGLGLVIPAAVTKQ